jgi:hypothetical protein
MIGVPRNGLNKLIMGNKCSTKEKPLGIENISISKRK